MTNRTSANLRDILFDEIDALRKPKGSPTRALAVSALAKQIINTVEAEMKFHQMASSMKDREVEASLGNLKLGSPSA